MMKLITVEAKGAGEVFPGFTKFAHWCVRSGVGRRAGAHGRPA